MTFSHEPSESRILMATCGRKRSTYLIVICNHRNLLDFFPLLFLSEKQMYSSHHEFASRSVKHNQILIFLAICTTTLAVFVWQRRFES